MDPDNVLILIGGTIEDWGFIPGFLDARDPRPAAQQINQHYLRGWRPFQGFTFDLHNLTLSYSSDPPLRPISFLQFREEILVLYPGEWVVIIQPNKSWEACRLD